MKTLEGERKFPEELKKILTELENRRLQKQYKFERRRLVEKE